jgi:transposase
MRAARKRREQRLARAGSARGPGMIQPAWRFLLFQRRATGTVVSRPHANRRIGTRKTTIPAFARTALARKLVIALWRFVTTGEPLQGVILRPAG